MCLNVTSLTLHCICIIYEGKRHIILFIAYLMRNGLEIFVRNKRYMSARERQLITGKK